MPNAEELQQFFLEAAVKTYAGGEKALRVADRRWVKQFMYERGDLRYVDEYMTSGEWSGGSTVILAGNTPLWLMQYHGWCKDDSSEVLEFLKEALLAAYRDGRFVGGRGLEAYSIATGNRILHYENREVLGSFENFSGKERIMSPEQGIIFWHRYQGLLLGR